MSKPCFRAVLVMALAVAALVGAASPVLADHTGFEKGEYQVGESAGYVELQVDSTFCCPPASGTIDYYTSNSTALAGQDYLQTSGTLTYPAERTIRVPIINGELFEDEEQFEVILTNFRGTFVNNNLGGRHQAGIVKIVDDDPRSASASPSLTRLSSNSATTSRSLDKKSQGTPVIGTQVADGNPEEPSRPRSEALTTNAAQSRDVSEVKQLVAEPQGNSTMLRSLGLSALISVGAAVIWRLRRRSQQSH
jgi:hypothetical protein